MAKFFGIHVACSLAGSDELVGVIKVEDATDDIQLQRYANEMAQDTFAPEGWVEEVEETDDILEDWTE